MCATYLSRAIDHLGDLGAKLGDLQGFRTLAHELIQNADDVPGATEMWFRVLPDALVVDNNGVFSDCGAVDDPECQWRDDPGRGHRCDFHRFRNIAGGDKRREQGTTGAFGIGFIAVYQLTNHPELISAGRHWRLDECQTPDKRIEVCPGCEVCQDPKLPATRFILPWAFAPDDALRKALRVPAVHESTPADLLGALREAVPVAMLFLKNLRCIEVGGLEEGAQVFECVSEGRARLITDGSSGNRVFHILEGNFEDEALGLRQEHPDLIEVGRSTCVRLAIPEEGLGAGLLCATLPTEHDVGLPFHVDASFYPTNDRKRVVFGEDYQADWNRAALRAAAETLTENLNELPALLGPQSLWRLFEKLQGLAQDVESGRGEKVLGGFWDELGRALPKARVVLSSLGAWVTPGDSLLLLQKEEVAALPVLEALGLTVVHENLRPFQNLLRGAPCRVPLLAVEDVCDVLAGNGFEPGVSIGALPPSLGSDESLRHLWGLLARLRSRPGEEDEVLEAAPIAPGRDGRLWPIAGAFRADVKTIELFSAVDASVVFLAEAPAFEPLSALCPEFDARAAVDALADMEPDVLERLHQQGELDVAAVISWFEDRQGELFADDTHARLARLPIFPSANRELRVLAHLALPGDFEDPLGLSEVVDLSRVGPRRDFLAKLGMRCLDFETYATEQLPRAWLEAPLEKRRQAVLLLARNIGRLRDSRGAQAALEEMEIVECVDGVFRTPEECYFDTPEVRECLETAPIASRAARDELAVRELYRWIGVEEHPRLEDVISTIRRLARGDYRPALLPRVRALFSYLGRLIREEDDFHKVASLATVAWLPGTGNEPRWYEPTELYASFRAYLFSSQGVFLDVPQPVQQESTALLRALGIGTEPDVEMVVKHLLHRAAEGQDVNKEVYAFLSDHADAPAVKRLRDRPCLYVDGNYLTASKVFWGSHPFGPFRKVLGAELRRYMPLFNVLGVREEPDASDAIAVLLEMLREAGSLPLDPEARAVNAACWELVESNLVSGGIEHEDLRGLGRERVVPRQDGVLEAPRELFFDNRAGLTEKFGSLLANSVVPRGLRTARALGAAGVRQLSAAVEVEMLECEPAPASIDLQELIEARGDELARVLDSVGNGIDSSRAVADLSAIRVIGAGSLAIRFSLDLHGRTHYSEPEHRPAHFDRSDGILYLSANSGDLPWAAISRELALALYPEEDPGRLAAGLKEVLSARSEQAARETLDDLGFAKVDATPMTAPPAAGAVTTLGTEGAEPEPVPPPIAWEEPGEESDGAEGGAATGVTGESSGEDTPEREEPAEPEEPGVSPAAGGKDGDETGRKGTPKRPSAKLKARPVLRSYVPSPGSTDWKTLGSAESESETRNPIDVAGVARVMEHERRAGRYPEEMPHKNPGFDIVSRDEADRALRYIEVKSLSGRWKNSFAELSRVQFEKAQAMGESFWLYVVEKADADDFTMYRIHDPALSATRFMFDDGWRALSEPDPIEESAQDTSEADEDDPTPAPS